MKVVTEEEAIEILKEFNEWRTGAETDQLKPSVITEALNVVIGEFESDEIAVQEKSCGFPCVCGAKDYEDASDKCGSIDCDGDCPAVLFFENHVAMVDINESCNE